MIKPLSILATTSALAIAFFSTAAQAVPGEGSFQGQIHLHPLGSRAARLHVRATHPGAADPKAANLFGVLAIADERGDFGVGLVYRFNEVKFDAGSGQYQMRLVKPSPVGTGNSIYALNGQAARGSLNARFTTTQVAPDGSLVEGELELVGSFET